MNDDSIKTGEQKTSEKKPVSAKKVFGIILNVILWLFVIFSIVVTVIAFAASSSSDGVPTIGGKVISPVITDSMADTINKGDIIISRKLNDDEKGKLVVGDIITFKHDLDGDGNADVNTHRIIGFSDNGYYKTKGDNKAATVDNYEVNPRDVISTFDPEKDTRIPVLGSVLAFLLTSTGFLVVIVIPLILFFVYEIFVFVRKLNETKNGGKKISAAEEELIKQRAIEEYLRSQKEQEAAGGSEEAAEEAAEEVAEEAAEEKTENE